MTTNPNARIVPLRGTVEDWAPEKEAEMLRKKAEYSRKMSLQDAQGEPDFEKFLKADLKSTRQLEERAS